MLKKLTSIVLALVMVLSIMTVGVVTGHAEELDALVTFEFWDVDSFDAPVYDNETEAKNESEYNMLSVDIDTDATEFSIVATLVVGNDEMQPVTYRINRGDATDWYSPLTIASNYHIAFYCDWHEDCVDVYMACWGPKPRPAGYDEGFVQTGTITETIGNTQVIYPNNLEYVNSKIPAIWFALSAWLCVYTNGVNCFENRVSSLDNDFASLPDNWDAAVEVINGDSDVNASMNSNGSIQHPDYDFCKNGICTPIYAINIDTGDTVGEKWSTWACYYMAERLGYSPITGFSDVESFFNEANIESVEFYYAPKNVVSGVIQDGNRTLDANDFVGSNFSPVINAKLTYRSESQSSDNVITQSGNNGTSIVTLDYDTANLKVTVPTVLPVNVDSNDNVTVADNAQISNLSNGSVDVTNAEIQTDEWSVVDFNTDFTKVPVDTKQYGFKLNGDDVSDGVNTSVFNTINGNDHIGLSYDANVAIQSQPITNEDIGRIVFTVAWHK